MGMLMRRHQSYLAASKRLAEKREAVKPEPVKKPTPAKTEAKEEPKAVEAPVEKPKRKPRKKKAEAGTVAE